MQIVLFGTIIFTGQNLWGGGGATAYHITQRKHSGWHIYIYFCHFLINLSIKQI